MQELWVIVKRTSLHITWRKEFQASDIDQIFNGIIEEPHLTPQKKIKER